MSGIRGELNWTYVGVTAAKNLLSLVIHGEILGGAYIPVGKGITDLRVLADIDLKKLEPQP
jgi:hypothetical protein